MVVSLSSEYEKHALKKKAMGSYAQQLSKAFKKGKLRRMLPFLQP